MTTLTPLSLTNAGFETGTLTGWSATVSSWLTGISGSLTADNTTSGDGTHSAKFVLTRDAGGAASGYATLTQNVTLEAGAYYRFELKTMGNLAYTFLRLTEADGGTYRTISDVSLDGTDSATWRTFYLNMQASADTAYQINLKLQQIPENTTQTLWVDSVGISKLSGLSQPQYVMAAIGDSQVSHLGLSANELNCDAKSFLLSSITRRQQTKTFEYMTPLNKGISGNTSAQVAARVQADVVNANPQPNICYVAVGTNDAAASLSIPTFRNNIIDTLDLLRAGGVTPILFTITPRSDDISVASYNAELANIAVTENVTLFDAHQVFIDSGSEWSNYWMDDAIHYNKLGHQALGRALGDLITPSDPPTPPETAPWQVASGSVRGAVSGGVVRGRSGGHMTGRKL